MLYLDTSLLVAALTNEAETERMQHWLGQQREGDLAVSDWAATVLSSALSIKLRTGQIGIPDRAEALATFTRLAADSFVVMPVSRLQFRTAARFADQHVLGLRAGDALHLAICGRSWRHALHARPAAERCWFGTGDKDDAALTSPCGRPGAVHGLAGLAGRGAPFV